MLAPMAAAPAPLLPAPPLPDWLARELPFRRALVDVGGGVRMHVMEQGAGQPVLLLHGNPTWGYLWRKVALALAGQPLRLVMPDLIGLGLSDKPRDPAVHSIDQHARWVGALVDALGLDRFILGAQDWGGPIGLRLLSERPSLAAGLVLGNTVVGPPRPGFRATTFHRFARLPLISDVVFRFTGFPQNILAFAQGDRSSISGDVARAYRWPLTRLADRVAPLALARMVPDQPSHPSIAALEHCLAFVDSFDGPMAGYGAIAIPCSAASASSSSAGWPGCAWCTPPPATSYKKKSPPSWRPPSAT
jgi:pimeloyl-ACP methyl ester carboxylesterase